MAHRADDIRHDIADTRAAMTEKLAMLEERVRQTAAGMQVSVEAGGPLDARRIAPAMHGGGKIHAPPLLRYAPPCTVGGVALHPRLPSGHEADRVAPPCCDGVSRAIGFGRCESGGISPA